MTKDEFETGYAKRSKMTVAELHALGQEAIPCDCEYQTCKGWQMVDANRPLKGART